MIAGSGIVRLLLAHAFWDAGWMFQILCIRTAMKCIFNPLSVCCTAIDALQSIASSIGADDLGGGHGPDWLAFLGPERRDLGRSLFGVARFGDLILEAGRAQVIRAHREVLALVMVGGGCAVGWFLSRFLP